MSTISRRNFAAGEIAPAMYPKVDQVKYQTGVKTMRNVFVKRHGGSASRPGTSFVCEVKDSSAQVRLVPFTPNSSQTFILEFGNSYMREILHSSLYVDGGNGGQALGTLAGATTITGIDRASQCTVTSASHGYSNGQELWLEGIAGMTELNGRNVVVSDSLTNSYKIKDLGGSYINSSSFTAYSSGGKARGVLQTTSPYATSEIDDFRFVQSQSVAIFAHPSYAPRSLTYTFVSNDAPGSKVFASVKLRSGIGTPTNVNMGTAGADGAEITWRVTAVNASTGEEGLYGEAAETNVQVPSGTNSKEVDWTPVFGASYYKIYRKIINDGSSNAARQYGFIGIGSIDDHTSVNLNYFYDTASEADIGIRPPWQIPILNYTFTISAGSATEGATYTNNSITFTVMASVSGATSIILSGAGDPQSSGTLTKATGDGDATLTFSAATTSDYPSCVGVFQQRTALGGSNNNRERVWASRTGASASYFSTGMSFQISFPSVDSDAIQFDLIGRDYNGLMHILEMEFPVVMTETAEYALAGDTDGKVTPTAVNKKYISGYGSSKVPPVVIGKGCVFVQAQGKRVIDLFVQGDQDGNRNNDLLDGSDHLTEVYTITDMAYQKTPNSILWLVRSDGTLLSLTYIKEQKILGWARHDFQDGTVENVCCIPEGTEHVVYVVVKRTINSRTTRYIERMNTRVVDDITDYVGMDSAKTQDGTNSTATTMTISGGTDWTNDELLTITASSVVGINLDQDAGRTNASTGHGFSSADVGNAVVFYDSDGVQIARIVITEVTSTTVVKGYPDEDIPAAIQGVATSTWGHAKCVVKGLWHLIGEDVSVFGDGYVVASPNNDNYDILTVASDGTLTMPDPYVKVHVGLPFISDIETLDVDSSQSETLANKQSLTNEVTLHLEKSRGIFVGTEAPSDDDEDPLENLDELRLRNLEGYNEPSDNFTGVVNKIIQGNWKNKGRVFIRQVDPLPMTVNSIMPTGLFPFRNQGGG